VNEETQLAERQLNFDFQHIVDAQGFELAFAGMVIVFVALAMVSLFIAVLPRVLPLLNRHLPEVEHPTTAKSRPAPAAADANEGAVAAAIAYVLHHRGGGK
jgi:oxaloacetate decarboxylase gamma subunit